MHKKHKDEWIDFSEKYIDRLARDGQTENYLTEKLNAVIKLHEQQKINYRDFYDANHKRALDLEEKHKKELDDFKKTL